jgi:hypothetical protein
LRQCVQQAVLPAHVSRYILDFLRSQPTPEQIAAFRPTPEMQELGESIFTQADSIQELRELVKDAVHCHDQDEATRPKLSRLHIVHDEVIAS